MTTLDRALVDAVGDAFNANDIDAVMAYFANNAIFDHAIALMSMEFVLKVLTRSELSLQDYLTRSLLYIGKHLIAELRVIKRIVNIAAKPFNKMAQKKNI